VLGGSFVAVTPERGIAIACATGESGDWARSVGYRLYAPADTLHAVVAAEGKAPAGARIDVSVRAESRSAGRVTVTPGRTADLNADVTGAGTVTITVTCQSAAGRATLREAAFRP
jgi:hypothetical protein